MSRGGKLAGALALALLAGLSSIATATVIQSEGLRISVLSQVIPYRLPRAHSAPIAVFVSGHLSNAAGGIPPQLRRLRIDVNRRGLLQSRGLPVCRASQLQPASTQTALQACGDALIGSGQFWANIVLPGQRPYPTQGRLLIFNGRHADKPTLLAHIYTENPFNSSFLIAFGVKRVSRGPYGTELSASLPKALGEWGYLDRIKLTLKRKYRYRGEELSYFNAACPAPRGSERTVFPLAYASFQFAGRPSLGATVNKSCAVAE